MLEDKEKEFEEYLNLKLSKKTVEIYMKRFKKYIEYTEKDNSIQEYLLTMYKHPSTFMQARSMLKNLIFFLKFKGYKDILQSLVDRLDDSVHALKLPKRQYKIYDYITDYEQELLKNSFLQNIQSTNDVIFVMPYIIMATLYYTGMRISECLNLKKRDFSIVNGELIVRIKGKGSKIRTIPINTQLQKFLETYIQMVPTNQKYLFLNTRGQPLRADNIVFWLKRAQKQANLPRYIHPHLFRHTFATNLLNKGVSLKEIQTLLGHSSISTTSIYLHSDIINLKKAVEVL